jgi:hypothetical protein
VIVCSRAGPKTKQDGGLLSKSEQPQALIVVSSESDSYASLNVGSTMTNYIADMHCF